MFSLRIIFGCFGPWTIFWVREEGGARYFFFCLFEISVPLAYVKYMACPYLINTHFWSFMGLGVIFWWDRKWVGQVNFFGIFEISFLLAFQQYITPKYLMNIHYFCSFWDHFWAWQGVGGTFFLFWFENTPLAVGKYCVQYERVCLSGLAKKVE